VGGGRGTHRRNEIELSERHRALGVSAGNIYRERARRHFYETRAASRNRAREIMEPEGGFFPSGGGATARSDGEARRIGIR